MFKINSKYFYLEYFEYLKKLNINEYFLIFSYSPTIPQQLSTLTCPIMYSYSSMPFDRELFCQDYIDYTPYKLVDWVNPSKLDITSLSANPRSLSYIIAKYGYTSVIPTNIFHMNPNSALYLENSSHKKYWYLQSCWTYLSSNPCAYNLIMHKIEFDLQCIYSPRQHNKLQWKCIPKNAGMYPILKDLKYNDKYNINDIALNPNPLCLGIIEKLPYSRKMLYNLCTNNYYDIMPYIYKHVDKLTITDWSNLSSNKYAVSLLEKNIDKIDWQYLSLNENACHLIEQNLDKINWSYLSCNPNALHILEKNIDKINWNYFIRNTNPECSRIIEENIHKYENSWSELCFHPNLISLLRKNQDKIDWKNLSMNPGIFEINYKYLDRKNRCFKDELIEVAWHPDRFKDWCLTEDEKEDIFSKFQGNLGIGCEEINVVINEDSKEKEEAQKLKEERQKLKKERQKIKEERQKLKEEREKMKEEMRKKKQEDKLLKKNKPKAKPALQCEYALSDKFRNFVNTNIKNLDRLVDPVTGFNVKLIHMEHSVIRTIVADIVSKYRYTIENEDGKKQHYIKYDKELYEIMEFDIEEGEHEYKFHFTSIINMMRSLNRNGHVIKVLSDY